MPPTIIYKKAANWVDRGEPPIPTMRRVLAHFFERFEPSDEPWLEAHAGTIVGMVQADATEIHIAAYLWSLIPEAALVREFAERVLRGEVPANEPTPDTFSHWVASTLLTPDELSRFEDQLGAARDESQ